MSSQKPKVSPDTAFLQNVATITAALELGGCTLTRIAGGEEASNFIGGELKQKVDFQEMLAARLGAKLGL